MIALHRHRVVLLLAARARWAAGIDRGAALTLARSAIAVLRERPPAALPLAEDGAAWLGAIAPPAAGG